MLSGQSQACCQYWMGQFILRQPQQLVLTLWHMMYPSAEAPRYMLGWRESPVGQTVMTSSASLRLATYFILARSSLFFPHLIAGVNPCALWYLIICLNMLYGSIFSQRCRISPKHELVNWPLYTGSHNLLSAWAWVASSNSWQRHGSSIICSMKMLISSTLGVANDTWTFPALSWSKITSLQIMLCVGLLDFIVAQTGGGVLPKLSQKHPPGLTLKQQLAIADVMHCIVQGTVFSVPGSRWGESFVEVSESSSAALWLSLTNCISLTAHALTTLHGAWVHVMGCEVQDNSVGKSVPFPKCLSRKKSSPATWLQDCPCLNRE